MSDDTVQRLNAALADRYRIGGELGEGGMATVYLAEDLRHERKVALKVLRPELVAVVGAERFLAEIKTTANLQHPHILPLFDSGEADGFLFYVMPYVDGESLRDALGRDKQFPLDDAVRIAAEVADALSYAHGKGVIHRDIKPENVLLRDGRAVVADFGIALAVSAAGGARLTETGLSLGTPACMSPEQATGDREVDGRSDVYALGCLLYEMLAGQAPHLGGTAQAILAKVLTEQPRPLEVVRETVPEPVAAIVHTALARLPADRFRSAAEMRDALNDPAAWGLARPSGPAGAAVPAPRQARPRPGLPWLAAAALAGAVATGLLLTVRPATDAPVSAGVLRASLRLPAASPLMYVGEADQGVGRRSLEITPDGRTVIYVGASGSTTQIFARDLGDAEVRPLPGTEGAYQIFVSPDGAHVGFFADGQMRRTPIGGGAVTTIDVPRNVAFGVAWRSQDEIVLPDGAGESFLQLPAGSGEPTVLREAGEAWLTLPHMMPGDGWVLGTINWRSLGMMDLSSGETYALTRAGLVPWDSLAAGQAIFGNDARYVRSGHVVYVRPDGVLMALPFSAEDRRVLGDARPVLEGVRRETPTGVGQFAVSDDGTLVYAPGPHADLGSLAWLGADGAVDTLDFPPAMYGNFTISPDGSELAALVFPDRDFSEVRLFDRESGVSQVVSGSSGSNDVIWWPEGRSLVMGLGWFGPGDVRTARFRLDAAGSSETLHTGVVVSDISRDGSHMVSCCGDDRPGVRIERVDGSGDAVQLTSEVSAWGAVLSPDGSWIAWTSAREGPYEVFVTAADMSGSVMKISQAGGAEPRWSRDGRWLIYQSKGTVLYRVDAPAPGDDRFGPPRELFRGPKIDVLAHSHDVHPDGRVLMVLGSPEKSVDHLMVVTNWFNELLRLAPPRSRGP